MRVRDCAHACAWDCATAVRTVVVLQEFLLCRGLCLSACNLFIITSPTPAAKCPLCKVLYTYVKAASDISNMPQLQTMQRQSDEFCRVALCVRLQLHRMTLFDWGVVTGTMCRKNRTCFKLYGVERCCSQLRCRQKVSKLVFYTQSTSTVTWERSVQTDQTYIMVDHV